MHTIIVCGTPWCEVKAVQDILEVAGVATARPAPSGSVTHIGAWHDRLFSSQLGPASAMRVGKAWELAASQIFLANWDQPVWGWADSRSTWLLDFWRDFDAGTHFILLYTPAQTVLTRVLADVSSDRFDTTIVLDQWCTYQTELLRFFHRNRSRCILLNADQALAAPGSFVHNINQQFQLDLRAQLSYLDKPENIKPLDQWLVQQLLQSHPATLALEQEIQASLPALQDVEQAGLPPAQVGPAPEAAVAQLRQLYYQQADLLIAMDRQAEQLGALQNQTQQQQQALQEQRQENELLLLQLHQVQEELESNFLQNQTLQQQKSELEQARDAEAKAKSEAITQRDALAKEKTALTAARDAEAKAKINALLQRDTLQQDNASFHNQTQQQQQALQEQRQENELLLLQLHQVQEELESNFVQNQTLQQQKSELEHARDAEAKAKSEAITQRDAMTKEKIALASARDAEAKAKKDALARCDDLQQDKARLHNQIQNQQQTQQDIQQENEVLLLQLHQVQEELEHYFLQHQQDKQILEARWDRLMARYPDYCEWDRIEVLDATESARWQVHGLMSMGRTLPLIDVSLDLKNGTRTLLLYPPAQPADAPLLHWSSPAGTLANAPLQILRLQPDAEPGSAEREMLRRLAPTDLLLLQTICSALAQGLPAIQPDREALVQHLQALQTQLKQLPATWRFDAVQLKHEQVNPGYEHLCFSLQNASFGDRQWPEFEFRIGAARVKKGKFSVLPRLEFPLPAQGNKQFENWFEESEDDRGPKFELRFDIKTNAIDINAWKALNTTDQVQVLSIMANLPQLLSEVEQQGATISRPWDDWQHLAIGMQKTLQGMGLPAKTFEVV